MTSCSRLCLICEVPIRRRSGARALPTAVVRVGPFRQQHLHALVRSGPSEGRQLPKRRREGRDLLPQPDPVPVAARETTTACGLAGGGGTGEVASTLVVATTSGSAHTRIRWRVAPTRWIQWRMAPTSLLQPELVKKIEK